MKPITKSSPLRHPLPLMGALIAFAFLLLPSPTRAAECSNDALRAAQTSTALPEGTTSFPACMALEMVSPPKKFVQPAFGSLFSADGERVLFKSTAGLAETPGLQSAQGDYYLASRGASSWATAPTSPPVSALIATGSNFGGPYAFSAQMDRWLLFGSSQAQNQLAALRFFELGLDGLLEPLSPLLVPNDDSGRPSLSSSVIESPWKGTSADLSTSLFGTRFASTTFLPGDPGAGTAADGLPGGDQNEYLVSRAENGDTSIELLARDKDGAVFGGFCGTHLGGGLTGTGNGRLDQGAISTDGSHIYFTTRPDQAGEVEGQWPTCDTDNPLRILERTMSAEGPLIEQLIPAGPTEASDLYQGASADQSKVFFTTARQAHINDKDTGVQCSAEPGLSDGCDLYLYDASLPEAERLSLISAGEGPTPGEGANVLSSITALSADGSHAYFVAEGILAANANPAGDSAIEGEPNLYLYDEGDLTFIGVLSPEDKGSLWGVERSFAGGAYAVPLRGGAQGGDGHILLLASSAPLTATDDDVGDRDVFRYDAEEATLQCISCAGIGPSADVSVNPYDGKLPAPNFTEPGRWVSEDGNTVAFATPEPLVEGDEDSAANPYLWAEGQLARLPAIVKGGGIELPAVSAPGNEVGFSTDNALLAVDGDTARDVYVARSGGGFPNPVAPIPCDPIFLGNCQGPPSPTPGDADAASASFTGPGNVKPKQAKKKHKKQKHKSKSKKKKQKQQKQKQQNRNGGNRK